MQKILAVFLIKMFFLDTSVGTQQSNDTKFIWSTWKTASIFMRQPSSAEGYPSSMKKVRDALDVFKNATWRQERHW